MTDPAQVTEATSVSAPWWGALGTVVGGIVASIAMVLGKRSDAGAKVETAEVEARVEMGREDTQRMRIRAEVDKGAFERALENKSVEHRECREEVRGLREEVEHLRSEIAECRKEHELRDAFEEWARANVVTKPNADAPPAPRVRQPTPANGTDFVRLQPARRDPRREP